MTKSLKKQRCQVLTIKQLLLSRYTVATMNPRQYDYFTVNFFPPESLGTKNIKDILSFVRSRFYWHNENSCTKPHIASFQGSALYEVTAILARFYVQDYFTTPITLGISRLSV